MACVIACICAQMAHGNQPPDPHAGRNYRSLVIATCVELASKVSAALQGSCTIRVTAPKRIVQHGPWQEVEGASLLGILVVASDKHKAVGQTSGPNLLR